MATHEEAGNVSIIAGLMGADPERVHQDLGEGTFAYWGQRSRRMPYCSAWRFNFYGAELSGDPDSPTAVYGVVSSATMRRREAPQAIEVEERTDWITEPSRRGGVERRPPAAGS